MYERDNYTQLRMQFAVTRGSYFYDKLQYSLVGTVYIIAVFPNLWVAKNV